ncbi:MAG: heme NO-binding domain-containing protein [Gaiellaceae bacterium]
MHGLIFTSFRRFADELDPELAEAASGYAGSKTYPDEELEALVQRAAGVTGQSRDGVLRAFGTFTARTTFHELYPAFYESTGGTRAFLLRVESHIHELVRATLPGSAPPRLRATPLGETDVVVSYTSSRNLCDLAEGLIEGVAARYGEQVTIEQPQCMHRGDPTCALIVTVAAR